MPRDLVRVLFVHGTLEIGGAEEVRLSLLTHLDRSRYRVTVCCLQRGGQVADEIAGLGYEVTVLGQRAHALSFRTLAQLRRLIREKQPHIVQTSLPRANYWGRIAAAFERVPVVIAEEHNVLERSDRVRPIVELVLGPRTDFVIAVSGAVQAAVAAQDRASAARPTIVIQNPVNARRLRPQRGRAEVRQQLRAGDSTFLIMHAGRMDCLGGQKGQDTIIEAAALLRPTYPHVAWVLLGDGPGRAQLQAMAEALAVSDRVHFTGFQRDIGSFLAAADAFAFPSRYEGMGVALAEAMWMGLPAVCSDLPVLRETLGGSDCGMLVQAESAEALAESIATLASDLDRRRRLGERARAYARETFTPERYAQKVSELWEQLLAAKTGRPTPRSKEAVR